MDFIKKNIREVPLYIIAAGLPLIIYFHIQYTGIESMPWFPNQKTWTDFFLYGKSKCVHFGALFMSLVLIKDVICRKIEKFEKEWTILLVFGILQLVSAFCSEFPQQSFFGGIEQYEPIWVLLGYLVIGCYAYQCISKTEDPTSILWALSLGAFISCVIGTLQLMQIDFWESDLGKLLLVPGDFALLRDELRFNFSQGGWNPVYLTSYNPNYAGIYLLMLIPMMFFGKNRKIKIIGMLGGICLIGTLSKTVLLASVFILVLGGILLKNVIITKHKKVLYGMAVLAVICGSVVVGLSANENTVLNDRKLQQVVCEEGFVKICYEGETISMKDVRQVNGGVKYEICYEDGRHVALKWNEQSGELDPVAEELQGLHFKVYEKEDISYAMFRYGDIPFRFTNDIGTEKYEYVTINGKIDELQNAKTFFEGHESFINGRGYIWGRTLPLILENPLLGTGPDSFMLTFPQNDYVVRANLGHSFFTQIITNAHSLYLHMAEQTGIPSLLCFMAFVLIYCYKSWKMYYGKKVYTDLELMGIGIFLGVIGYLICGITFASSVCTTPLFWLLLGMGIGINRLNQRI